MLRDKSALVVLLPEGNSCNSHDHNLWAPSNEAVPFPTWSTTSAAAPNRHSSDLLQSAERAVKTLHLLYEKKLEFPDRGSSKWSKPELTSDDARVVISSSFPICLPASGKEIKLIGDMAAPQDTLYFWMNASRWTQTGRLRLDSQIQTPL